MPRKDKQLDERGKLKRDLDEQTAILELWKNVGGPSPAFHAAVTQRVMRINQLSERDLKRRHELRVAMGNPELTSPEWRAALERLRPRERPKRQRALPANVEPLFWVLMHLSAGMPAGQRERDALERFGLQLTPEGRITLPGQRRIGHSKQQHAEARRMYRWLWRTFPGLLNACDDELRELIRKAGGAAK